MKTNQKQGITIAGIVIAGLIAALALLLTGRGDGRAPQDGAAAPGKPASGAAASEPASESQHADEPPGLIELTSEQIRNANLEIRTAGPGRIRSAVEFPGEIKFNADRTAHVVPRVAGVVESVSADLGQRVKKGDLLAVFASTQLSDQRSELLAAQRRLELARTTYAREKKLWEDKVSAEQDFLAARTALQEAEIAQRNAAQKLTAIGARASAGAINQFELRAPFDGIIVEKHLALGEAVAAETAVFTISDLTTVWAEFVIAPKDLGHVKLGESVRVASAAFDGKADGKVSYVGALLGQQTRTATARVTLPNPEMAWRPGLFVTVSVATGDAEAAVVIEADAVQTEGGQPQVFVEVPQGFIARAVKTGRTDGTRVEIVDGLAPGTRYVAANSFVLKAEQGKGGAEHAH